MEVHGIKEESLINLPHGVVGASNGTWWCLWESIDDFHKGYYPYEGEIIKGKSKKMYTQEDAVGFANRYHKAMVRKYGKDYNKA